MINMLSSQPVNAFKKQVDKKEKLIPKRKWECGRTRIANPRLNQ